ncbi:MAG TPA: uroporphyrinogen-III C-methyltransferase, partial [Chloroflexota bacterium]
LGGTRSVIDPDRWQSALGGEVEYLASIGALQEATDLLVKTLERSLFEPVPESPGLVSLVGAGPGAPDLLTLRAVERLRAADVVVHDRLVSDAVLEYAAPSAERIDVGKRPGGKGASQTDINTLLVGLAQQGRRVVRLKGGDPFVFGRGGEEALALAQAGVEFEVVPGISSALASPAAAGVPVTHRGLSASVTVVNGHDAEQHDWAALARGGGTLVFLMAVEHLEGIVERLLAYGRSPSEPTALIEWATLPRQRVLAAPLDEVAVQARLAEFEPPAVLVVGPTAALVSQLGPRGARAASRRELVAS